MARQAQLRLLRQRAQTESWQRQNELLFLRPYCGRWFLHKFRHTYTTRHLQDGIDIRTLQQWMGHRDIASTMVYLKGVRNRDIQARLNKGSIAAFA